MSRPAQAASGTASPAMMTRLPALAVAAAVALPAVALSWAYSGAAPALWLTGLGLLTYLNPAWGVALLFIAFPIDTVIPLFGRFFVSLSELELAVCAAAFWASDEGRGRWFWRPLLWAGPLLAAAGLSGLAGLPWEKTPPHLLRLAELPLAAVLACNVMRSRGGRKAFLFALVGVSLVYPLPAFRQLFEAWGGRIFSFFDNPNQFAGYLVLTLPFLLTLGVASTGRRRWGGLGLASLTAACLLLTLSRAAIAASLVGLCLTLLLLWRRSPKGAWTISRRRLGASVAAAAVLVGLLGTLFVHLAPRSLLLDQLRNLEERDLTSPWRAVAESRLPFFKVGFEIWKDNPWLGVGPGNYQDVLPRYQPVVERLRPDFQDHQWELHGEDGWRWVQVPGDKAFEDFKAHLQIHTHNLYLQLAVDFGLLGLSAYLLFMGHWAVRFWNSESPWAVAALGMLSGFLIHNLLDVTFPSLALEQGWLLGAALGLSKVTDDRRADDAPMLDPDVPSSGGRRSIEPAWGRMVLRCAERRSRAT